MLLRLLLGGLDGGSENGKNEKDSERERVKVIASVVTLYSIQSFSRSCFTASQNGVAFAHCSHTATIFGSHYLRTLCSKHV